MSREPTCTVARVTDRRTLRDWLAVPKHAYADDPAWICPLDLMERQRVSRRHNPFFRDGEADLFVAYRDGRPVGRISAQLNRRYLDLHRDSTGHFGFFDCIDDRNVAASLLDAAEQWHRARGLEAMQGPFNLTINQDTGLLVGGFEHPPAIMTSHAGPWMGGLAEASGLHKVMDFFAYRMNPANVPDKAVRLANMAKATGRLRIRNVDMSRYDAEARLIFDIFNDAWSENWGFVPIPEHEMTALAKELKPIMRSKFAWIVDIDGIPSAMMVVLPDLNQVIRPFGGRLLPFNWLKLAHAIWRDDWRTARVPLLGIRKLHRGTPLAVGVLSVLIAGLAELGRQYDIEWIEYSWVLETNTAMTSLAEMAAGKPAKIYRAYGKTFRR